MILLEENFETISPLIETVQDKKKIYLTGVMSQANTKNRNGRIYERSDLEQIMRQINEAAKLNRHILGETDHPSTLEVKLKNVSHKIVSAWMEGDDLMFKSEVLTTPSGLILQSLIESGVQVGVSTRGSGAVNESTGRVSKYRFVTLDAVATPSCQNAYPETLEEQFILTKMGVIPESSMAQDESQFVAAFEQFMNELKNRNV